MKNIQRVYCICTGGQTRLSDNIENKFTKYTNNLNEDPLGLLKIWKRRWRQVLILLGGQTRLPRQYTGKQDSKKREKKTTDKTEKDGGFDILCNWLAY